MILENGTVRTLDPSLPLRERSAGTYGRMFPVVGMSGRWGCRVEVAPRGGRAFQVTLVDRMLG